MLEQYFDLNKSALSKWIKTAICLVILFIQVQIDGHPYPDFDQSLKRHGLSDSCYQQCARLVPANRRTKHPPIGCRLPPVLEAYKELYIKNMHLPIRSGHCIPPLIHQIWIGKEMPWQLQILKKTWEGWPGWTYKLWTEEDLERLEMVNRDLYDQSSDFREKADIARLEILRQYGGIYVDTDMECLDPIFFCELARKFTFVAAIEPLEAFGCCRDTIKVCNAFICTTPSHPLIEKLNNELASNYRNNIHLSVLERTGPIYFGNLIPNHMSLLNDGGIILPPTFVYPVLQNIEEFTTLKVAREKFIHPETAAIHYWDRAWKQL